MGLSIIEKITIKMLRLLALFSDTLDNDAVTFVVKLV
jgi:hypothetical protein